MMNYGGGFRLVVRRGPQPNQVYELNRDMMTIGRDVNNEITVNDPEVSRHHCRLTRGPSGYTIEDLGSTNGTFVNGRRLTGAQPLNPGDLIGLGETVTLAYETSVGGGAAPAPAPSAYAPSASAPQGGYAAPPPQDPYYAPPPVGFGSQPQPAFAQPAPYYNYDDQARGNRGCGVLIGCSIFVVLALVSWIVAIVVIDSPLDDVRGISDAVNAVPLPGSSVDNVENFVDALQNNCNVQEAKSFVCEDEAAFLDNPNTSTGLCGALTGVNVDCRANGNDVTCDLTPPEGQADEITFNIKNGQICGIVISFETPSTGTNE